MAILKFLPLLLAATTLASAESRLKVAEVRPTMEEMLAYHVEHKEMSPLLMKRAFKIYIEQFDPHRVYLLQEEVESFFEPSSRHLQTSVSNFRAGKLDDFVHLNLVIQKAIDRARVWRREIQKELVLNGPSENSLPHDSNSTYAKTLDELKARQNRQMVRVLLEEKRANNLENWTPEQRAKIFQLWQRRLLRKEEPYLLVSEDEKFLDKEKGETLFCLHTLRSLAKSLDAHTAYFSPEEAADLRTSLEKQFEGVGVVLREGLDGVIVTDLIKGGPAQRSGKIAAGDILTEIDGKSLAGMPYELVLEEMKGSGKREVILGFKRADQQLIRVPLLREKITMQDERLQFTSQPFAGGVIGTLVLPSFYEGGHLPSAEQDIRDAIKKLKKQGDLKGLILDLRENAGGFLSQAVKVAGLFITRGVIVISKYAQGEMRYLREIDGRTYFDGPLVILTSKGSASAAEIVAQALQDYGTAVIAGDERTYGKGTIQYQTVTDDAAKAFFKVTVGRYYTVSGRTTQIEGVKADVLVPTELAPFNIGEKFLEYPLPSDRVPAAYVDPLNDVDERNKVWFQKNYLPNLQAPQTFWQKNRSTLVQNSGRRIERDKNFKLFLKDQDRYQGVSLRAYSKPVNPPWGEDDLQMAEARNILKDMIELQARSTKK